MMKKAIVFLESCSRRFPSSSPRLASIYRRLSEVYQKHQESRMIPHLKLLSKKYRIFPVAMDSSASSLLRDFPHKLASDYVDASEVDEKSMEYVRSFLNSNMVRETFEYDGYNLWELYEAEIWEGFISGIIKRAEIVRTAIEREKPDCIVLLDSNSELGKVIRCFPVKIDDQTSLASSSISAARKRLLLPALRYAYRKEYSLLRPKSQSLRILPDKKRVLMLTDNPRSISSTLPWAKKLDKSLDLLAVCLCDESEFRKQSVNFRPFSSYITKDVEGKIRLGKKEFAARRNRFYAGQKATNYKEIPIYKPLSEMFDYLLNIRIPINISQIEICKKIIQQEKPSLGVLYGDRLAFGKTVCRVFEQHSIPTLVIQLGMMNQSPLFGRITSTKMAVFGNQMKNILVGKGNAPSKLAVTGQPRFDAILKEKYSRELVFKRFSIPGQKKIVLFTSQNFHGEEGKRHFSAVMNAAKKTGQQLIIKLHPDEHPDFAERIKSRLNSDAIITKYSLYELMNASSAIITFFSTTAWEALLFNKPLIIINLTGEEDRIDCVEKGAAIGVYRESELLPAIRTALYDRKKIAKLRKASKCYNYDHTYKSDGKASERVAKLIGELAK
ncbi:MAG TPA: UDP-N-acetylglucosamine 2-epimerase [Candidatus Nanoarchaeia archaeon]|nr:UDP-N-acetylglucosamine 2-epimerase [Candidatus Nanoarchaeia archaeon]